MKLTKILAGVLIACSTAVSTGAARAETRITVADAFPSGHYLSEEAVKFWMERVKERSNGEVAFDYFTSGQMGPLADMLDMAKNGIADVTYVPMSSFADRLPLSGVTELPGFFDKSVRGTAAFQAFLASDLAKEEFEPEGVVPLFGAMLPPYQVASTKAAINSKNGFDGVRLRTPGGILEIAAQQLGATAVPMGGPDMYAALQRGTVDATVNAFGSLKGYRLNEVLKAVSDNGSFGSFAFTLVIGKEKFESLPDDVRTAMTEAGAETAKHVAEWMDDNEQKIAKDFAGDKIDIYSIDKPVLEDWNGKLAGVADTWAKRLDDRGKPGTDTLQKWKAALDAVK